MDSEIFFAVHLRRILDPAGERPTVAELEEAFNKFIHSRSSNASAGMPPADYKTLLAEATESTVASLAASLQQTRTELDTLRNARQAPANTRSYPPTAQNTRGGGGGGGGGGTGGNGGGGGANAGTGQRKRKRGRGGRGGGAGAGTGGGPANTGGGQQGGGQPNAQPAGTGAQTGTGPGQLPKAAYCYKFNDRSGCPIALPGKQ